MSTPIQLAGEFCRQAILHYIEDVNSGANPATPFEIGGAPYRYFTDVLEDYAAQATRGADKEELSLILVKAVEDFVGNIALQPALDTALNKNSLRDIERFSGTLEVAKKLLDGQSPESLLHGAPAIQQDGIEPV